MRPSKYISFLLLGAILALGAADCVTPLLNAPMSSQESDCCASGACSREAAKHPDCCQTMASADSKLYQTASKIEIAQPVLIVLTSILELPTVVPAAPRPDLIEVHQHAPPQELYTAYHSLLI